MRATGAAQTVNPIGAYGSANGHHCDKMGATGATGDFAPIAAKWARPARPADLGDDLLQGPAEDGQVPGLQAVAEEARRHHRHLLPLPPPPPPSRPRTHGTRARTSCPSLPLLLPPPLSLALSPTSPRLHCQDPCQSPPPSVRLHPPAPPRPAHTLSQAGARTCSSGS